MKRELRTRMKNSKYDKKFPVDTGAGRQWVVKLKWLKSP